MAIRKRVLVIDDDETVRLSCQRVLSGHGYEVETASSGRRGVAHSTCGYFDCALVDLKIPDVDGMEIVRMIRQNRANVAVLIITGYGTLETAAEATRLGVSDYVSKPFTPDEIVQAVGRALANSPRMAVANVLDRVTQEIRDGMPKPEHYEPRGPQAIAEIVTRKLGVKKATASVLNVLLLGILAGVYIGFGAALATLVATDAANHFGVGVARVLVGMVFSVGLILVVIAGAELFTGNNLMIASVLAREYGPKRLVARWAVVYAANFAGAVLLVLIMFHSGLWKMAGNAVGTKAIALAGAKLNLSFGEAFLRGVGCNWLVCLAVWMAFSAKDIAGKVLVIFFPIMSFVALGYEHCVANMYFVPMGLLLKGTVAAEGLAGPGLTSLTWWRFLTANLIPVTLGNIVGGAVFVGCVYWWVYMRRQVRNV